MAIQNYPVSQQYESAKQADEMFRSGRFGKLPEFISIAGIPYFQRDNIMHPIPEMVENDYKAFVVYAVTGQGRQMEEYEQLKAEGTLSEWLLLIWSITPYLTIRPARAVQTTAARAKPHLKSASGGLKEAQNNVIPDVVQVRFDQFGKVVNGKADTGANLSSIHADKWEEVPQRNLVKFQSKILSDNIIQVPYVAHVTVQTSEGSEIRPVVELDVTINGKRIPKAKFNLNDRGQMEHQILIGQNILEKGNFLIDPSRQPEKQTLEAGEGLIDWDYLQEQYKDVHAEETEIDILYRAMLESDFSFQDLVRHIKTQAIQTLNETIA